MPVDPYAFEAMNAARDAAFYAAWSAAAAWIVGLSSLVLTGGGLLFIWRQLKATELSADAARQAAVAAVAGTRPWVKLDVKAEVEEGTRPGELVIMVDSQMTNVGATPAAHVEMHVEIPETPDFSAVLDTIRIRAREGVTLFPGESTEDSMGVPLPPECIDGNTAILVVATYRAGGSQEVHVTPQLCVIVGLTGKHVVIRAMGKAVHPT